MEKHLTHTTHANSARSFSSLDHGTRLALVLSVYRLASGPLTDRAVASRLGFQDLNAVRPRVVDAIDNGLLYETGSTVCPVTNRRVRTCALTSLAKPEPRQALLDEVLS